ncbi:OsmC family protein [Streptomyces sp. NPDC050743]|uniref:OsmC family protein n=1 Tax=Streptomyces sp. NPDC050743 TaxID=3365634 RepID=UPI00378E4CA8
MNTRIVSISEGPRLARSIAVGPHVLAADEPQPISTDTGPTPGELLLAALGSCTSMAVRAFADRHGWPLDHVDVTVRFDRRGQIVKEVRLTGDLEPDRVEQLLTVARRCPVQRLLTRTASVVTVPTLVAKSQAPADPSPPR